MSNEWWGADDPEGTSWKTGSEGKRQRMAIYVEWLLTPRGERQPSTKKELAEKLGVTPTTLRNYQKDRWLQAEMAKKARGEARIDRLPDVLSSLYDQAVDRENPRSVQAAKAYLKWLEETEAARVEEDLEDMSDEDLATLTQELLKRQAQP